VSFHATARRYNVRMILDRRGFLSGLPALLPAALEAAEEGPRTRFYLMEKYDLYQYDTWK